MADDFGGTGSGTEAGRLSRFAAADRETRARKAVDLEALLVWAFRDQCADRADAAWERMGYGPSADGCAAVERYHTLGAFVDCSRPSPVPMAVHPDAVLVEALVGNDTLLAMHARMGQRPDWLPGVAPRVAPRWKPGNDGLRRGRVEDGRIVEGKVEKIWDKRRNAIGCEVELINPPAWIAGYRRQYLDWHRRMTALLPKARTLALRDHEVAGFAAPERPWEAQVIEGVDFTKTA